MILSGCTGVNLTVDSLLAAPKLTDEQSQIHAALIAAVGRNITLKYPRGGANRSAYVIANVDGEPTEEALVFYEYTGAENEGVRVNLLDRREDGSWYSVREIAGAGTEIDKVVISAMGSGSDQDILVGYQNITGENALEIYSYSGETFQRIGADSYSLLETVDINSDGKEEIVTIQRIQDSETGTAFTKAYLLRISDGEIVKDDGIDMMPSVQSYVKAYKGRLKSGDPAVYIDELDPDGQLRTELVFYRYSGLQNPVRLRAEKMAAMVTRPAGYNCADLDGDGVYEIPSCKPMLGYEDAVAEEQVLKTTWSVYEDFYKLTPKISGYHSVADGYTLEFPQRWTDTVTVKTDADTGEAVFYKYEGDINAEMQELMRIKTVRKDEAEELLYNGYRLIVSSGQIDYLVKLPTNKREKLILTIDEVQNNFYPITN
ncbi:hypothetical protein SAMN02910447_01099 [Ruminococcus sp. YE71]|nr:hypothetical protein [Ruminococcus sp. YE78]SDA16197.1 hypothetical protein SAMN02910446_01098 [Ruminococcus sp. YE78]SFW24166.1 hypothetical protein SAMN02910447_01099 [Ruminococcus sp. YE71]